MNYLKTAFVFLFDRIVIHNKTTIAGWVIAAIVDGANMLQDSPSPKIHALALILGVVGSLLKDKGAVQPAIKSFALLCFGALAACSGLTATDNFHVCSGGQCVDGTVDAQGTTCTVLTPPLKGAGETCTKTCFGPALPPPLHTQLTCTSTSTGAIRTLTVQGVAQ